MMCVTELASKLFQQQQDVVQCVERSIDKDDGDR
jgi:hypothetical protein